MVIKKMYVDNVCMYVWSSHIAKVTVNRVRLPILLVSIERGK